MSARFDFASDNTSGAMPEVMAALAEANRGVASGYGTDPVSTRAAALIRELIDADAEVRFLASGTAANAVSTACLAAPHEAIAAHQHAHICTDETGAPVYYGGGLGLVGLPGASGRIEPAALAAALAKPDDARVQSCAGLSLTNATEYGAVYSNAALAELAGIARAAGCGVHLDGARLANAVAAGFDLKAAARQVDILVIGGTKVGSTPTEALVVLDPKLSKRLDARLKHAGQLISKGRFTAAPWIGMLETGAWETRAAHANAMARELTARMPFPIRHPVETNSIFVEMDQAAVERLRQEGWMTFRFLDGSVRFMCSWATTLDDVEGLAAALKAIA